MANSSVPITAGSGTNIDTRTDPDGNHRQVVVLGDESTATAATIDSNGLDVDITRVPTDPFGTNADAAVAAGAAGSISAKLRRLSLDLATLSTEIQGVTQAEDAPAASGDMGIMALGVRKDTGGTLASADGDYTPPQYDASGNLRVNVAAGGTSGTQYADGTTAATPTGTAAMGRNPSNVMRPLLVDASGNLLTAIASGTLSITGEDHIGEVGGRMIPVRPTMTITAGAYAAGEVIGGELTLTNAMRVSGGTGMLHKLTIVDKGNVKPELRCLIFDSNPTGTFTDNNLMTINSADYVRIVADLHIASTDYVTYDDAVTDFNVATLRNLGEDVAAQAGSQDLWAVFTVVGTPTFTGTSQLVPTFWFIAN